MENNGTRRIKSRLDSIVISINLLPDGAWLVFLKSGPVSSPVASFITHANIAQPAVQPKYPLTTAVFMATQHANVIILGSGPAGYTAAV
ncbi:MAG: hypothetical protein KDF67_03315, partial [Ottowia sp.]|nr:hypothetical protein [Ottowia sp.]